MIKSQVQLGKYVTIVKNSKNISTVSYVDLYTHLKIYEQHTMKNFSKMNQTSRNVDPLAYMALATQSRSYTPSQYVPPPPQEILEVRGESPEVNLKQLKTMKVDEQKLEDIPIIRDFPGMFPEDLLELQELSNQLKELQEKESPWPELLPRPWTTSLSPVPARSAALSVSHPYVYTRESWNIYRRLRRDDEMIVLTGTTQISPRTLDKRREIEHEDLENSEPDDEETEFEEQDLKKEKFTKANDYENETENNEVRSIKSKTNQKGKKKMLLYLYATISKQLVVKDETPLMNSWDTMKLKLREKGELNMGGFGRLSIKEAYRYVKKQRLTIGKIKEMKNSPAKDQGDILRHVYTPKVNLEDDVFRDIEGSNKMEEIENSIMDTLKFMESMHIKVDEMLEIASIRYPDNEEFRRLVEYKNERIMKEFKPGKVTQMLHFENVIDLTQPERKSPTKLETIRETPENELEANLDRNVGGGGNENALEANLDGNVGEGDDYDVDMGSSMDKGKETNLDKVLKEGDNDISKRDKENTLSQILTKMNTKKHHTIGDASRIVGGYVQATNGP
nr:hypothetical protein [Tanacetum cinerariifolium]